MSEDYNDPAREAARYLHFEYENPAIPDVQFDSITDALNWMVDQGWGPESWFQPTGMIEEKIRVLDTDLGHMGDLIRVREEVTTWLIRRLIRDDGQHQTQVFIWRRP